MRPKDRLSEQKNSRAKAKRAMLENIVTSVGPNGWPVSQKNSWAKEVENPVVFVNKNWCLCDQVMAKRAKGKGHGRKPCQFCQI